ncbi:hypothetical protein BpHYR1_051765 [Brachionus plicatilis]|uniref:Uncharacterized protein n=1 Tax=Brachionus plicatilis TaxID=10195 RepID=A0A3M7T1H1_BRAPC|nr:hypothetical protein BpHYR1_051765 [Brachionus plicatilis]
MNFNSVTVEVLEHQVDNLPDGVKKKFLKQKMNIKTSSIESSKIKDGIIFELGEVIDAKVITPKKLKILNHSLNADKYFANINSKRTPHLFNNSNDVVGIDLDENEDDDDDPTVQKLIQMSIQNSFPKKTFYIGNIKKHLKTHETLIDWFTRYKKINKKANITEISDEMLNFIKWLVTSYQSFEQLKRPFFCRIVNPELKIPNYRELKEKILPEILNKFHKSIENKLNMAISIFLIIDIWTSESRSDFIACGAIKKLNGITCDEGSSLIRLFKQILFEEDKNLSEKNEIMSLYTYVIASDDSLSHELDLEYPISSTEANLENNKDIDHSQNIVSSEELPGIFTIDSEVTESIKDIESLRFKHVISLDGKFSNNIRKITQNINITESVEYAEDKGEPFMDFNIEIGDNVIPRYSCACHKLNIAVRHAFSIHELSKLLKELNTSNSHVRNSIKLNDIFREKKCRLRLENLTRWSSAFMMLESVKRAYDKGAFNENNLELKCPVQLKTIETYIQILKPAYLFSIGLQNNNTSIVGVLPGLFQMLYICEKMDLEDEIQQRLCALLMVSVRHKFDFELNSPIYKAAPVLAVSKISHWTNKKFSRNILKDALASLKLIMCVGIGIVTRKFRQKFRFRNHIPIGEKRKLVRPAKAKQALIVHN